MRNLRNMSRFLASAAAVAMLATGLAGCQTTSPNVTGSLGARAEARAPEDTKRNADDAAERFRANPKDVEAALNYGQSLRANGQRSQAVAVLEQATIANPGNKALLAAYGRALADNGNLQQAFDTLAQAHSPQDPNWRVLSVQGAVLDQQGKHKEAQRYYASALKIAPEEPSVLSNLGLSYILTKDLPKAESTLQRALAKGGNADPRIRQNLALAIGLQGRYAEAETIAKADLPPEEAEANVAYLKQLMNGNDEKKRRGVNTATAADRNRS
ncbi:MAG: tetratricopeptide repeat protein [Pseudomonadota bacterium]